MEMSAISKELDLCFVEATGPISDAVQHILNGDSCREELKEELLQWQHGVSERRGKDQETAEYSLGGSVIPFDLVVRIHDQLKVQPLG